MKWLIFVKLFFEIFIKTSLAILGLLIIVYAINVSRLWSRFDISVFLTGVFGLLIIIAVIKFNLILKLIKKIPLAVKIACIVICCVFVSSFIIIQGVIISNMSGKPPVVDAEIDYVIVLGCQVVGIYPSFPLVRRINTASKYLLENPDVMAVASGGQGPGEDIPEADVIRKYLIENGIEKERILIEDKSRNTVQNLKNSDELFNLKDKNILIVTTDYHMFRSIAVAKKLGYKNVYGLPSISQRSVLPAYLFREYASVMYYILLRRI
ncbi:MAG: YdcF family protein [Treponema sp.]|nr:YdcF family protein [Treponema sp.]